MQQKQKRKEPALLSPRLFILVFSLFIWTACQKTATTNSPSPLDATANSRNGQNPSRMLDLQMVTDNLVSPLTLAEPSDGSHRLFIVDQIGKIWILDSSGHKKPQPFLDLTAKIVHLSAGYDERGLLSMAFHPDFRTNGKFYVFYTAPPPPGGPSTDAGNTGIPKVWNNTTMVSEFRVSSNPDLADMNSERVLLHEPHPQSNHNGGTVAFGPDGYLYISIGDGGNKNDLGPGHVEDWYAANAGGNGQDIEQNLLGNILRIDVNSSANGKNYAIPGDNPFVGKRGLDEIWAYGFRNPYRFSFDMSGAHKLYAGDAGQSLYEEIDDVVKGGNYGWNVKEGPACFNAANEFTELPSCPGSDAFGNPLIDPVIAPANAANPEGGHFVVIVAGNVYRGHSIPGMEGKYLFGNFSSSIAIPKGEVYSSNTGQWSYEKLRFRSFPTDNIGNYVKGFGQDLNGEVYVMGSQRLGPAGNTGKVFRIVAEK